MSIVCVEQTRAYTLPTEVPQIVAAGESAKKRPISVSSLASISNSGIERLWRTLGSIVTACDNNVNALRGEEFDQNLRRGNVEPSDTSSDRERHDVDVVAVSSHHSLDELANRERT